MTKALPDQAVFEGVDDAPPDRIVSTLDGAANLIVDVAGSDAPLSFVRAPIRR
ncbi:MAG TPA: hypothetical protein VLT32_04180 [Candidatus Sulfomarinibacteraceae bacterium]|nr:hypothetical protein [Candidatus Sulfomarinibacteraceae bacterium]